VSTIKVDTVQSTGGGAVTLTKQEAAKHWLFYEMNESTPVAADSFNHSSITDNNNGCHTITMASPMATINYCTLSGCGRGASSAYAIVQMQMNQSAVEVPNTTTTYTFLGIENTNTTLTDFNTMSVGVFGDLP
jgi:hypothetical protein|tara:strand:- start:883 stop:1281 length:399 start_codon:yes stop_codon:yes gene_type:complete